MPSNMRSLVFALAGSASFAAAKPLVERDSWADWSSVTTTKPVVAATTTTKPVVAATTTPTTSCVYTSSGVAVTAYGAECGEWHATTTTTTTTKPVAGATTTPASSCVYTSAGVVATGYGSECAEWSDWTSSTTTTTTKPVKATTSCVYTSAGVVATAYGTECAGWSDWVSTTTTTSQKASSTGHHPHGTPPSGPSGGSPPSGPAGGAPPSGPAGGAPPSGPSCTPTPSTCLTGPQATSIVNQFIYLLVNPQAADFTTKANALLASNFNDTSDSISWLAGAPLGQPIFPSKQAFIVGQGQQPPIPSVTTLGIFFDCHNIAWRWVGNGIGSGKYEVRGIDTFLVNDQFQIAEVNAEFNVGAWETNIGGTCTHPPAPSST